MKEEARTNVKVKLTKALEKFTQVELSEAYGCKPANFSMLIKRFDDGEKINNSTVVRVNRAINKLEGKQF